MTDLDLLRVARLTIAVLGIVIVFLGLRAFSKTKSMAMLLLSLGFLLIALGYAISGLLFEFVAVPLEDVLVVESSLTAAGFIGIILSLYWAKD